MKSNSGNPNKGQQQYSSKFDKESMDHQPHPVQKHFVNQQSPSTYPSQQGVATEDMNEFQLEQYYEQMQAIQNQDQISKYSLQKQQQQLNQQQMNLNSVAAIAASAAQQQLQQQHNNYHQMNTLQQQQNSSQQHQQQMYKQQQLQQQYQQAQVQQQSYDKKGNQFQQSSEYSSDDMQDEHHTEGIDEEHIYENQQMVQFANHLSANGLVQGSSQNNNLSQGSNPNQNSNTNNSFSSADEIIKSTDDTTIKEEFKEIDKLWQKQLIQDSDGVIYNLEMSLKEEDSLESMSDLNTNLGDNIKQGQNFKSNKKKVHDRELLAYKIKKQTFLVKSYLQCCAILSQQGLHQKALDTANEGANVLKRIFGQCYEFCKEVIKENEMHLTCNTMIKSPRQMFQNGLSQGPLTNSGKNNGSAPNTQRNNSSGSKSQPYHFQQNQNNYFSKENNIGGQQQNLTTDFSMDSMISSRKSVQQAKEEVYFQKLVVEYAFNILQDVQNMISGEDSDKTQVEHFRDARRSLYFWKNNPENNERHIRQELNVPTKLNEEETRSILGVQNGSEWIESFNIGSIMHMVPVQYEEFSFFGDVMYEISKKMILEKVIYLSISYFTIATEIRFIEIERNKHINPKGDQNKNIDSEGFKKSQIYHLKSIEIVCQHITCKSPYINHLITSYHKHYNQNLETILEESFSSFQDNNIFDGSQHQQIPFINNPNHQQYNILQQEDQLREGKQFEELVNKFVNGMSEDDQTPVYIQNNPHLSGVNAQNINNSSLNTLQNSSMTKFNPLNGQIIQSDDIILNNEKRIPSPNTNSNPHNIKKSHGGLQLKLQNGSQSSRSQYSQSTKNSDNTKEKKISSTKQPSSLTNSVLTNSALNKKNLNLDFNGGHASSHSTNHHASNINSQNLNSLNRNLAEFFSHENSKKNTPRGILNIRKSTPAVEQSSKEVALTEPNASSSTSQPRSTSKTAKKVKQNNSQTAQIKKMNALSIEKVTQILKNNLLASYSTAFLSSSNIATLNHSKNPSSNQERKKPQTSNSASSNNQNNKQIIHSSSSQQSMSNTNHNLYPSSTTTHNSKSEQALNSSPSLKKKTPSSIQQDPLRKSACVQSSTSANGQRTNNSSIKNNVNNNSSSVPSTTQSSTKSKKQASATSRQQTATGNLQTQQTNSSNSQVQQYCNTDRQLKESGINQQKVNLSEAKDSLERNKIIKHKTEGKTTTTTTQPFTEDINEQRKKVTSKGPTSSSKNGKEQKSSENRKVLNPSISAQNFLSLKTIKKETIQQLLKDSKIIPKLNLTQLKLKTDEIRFFSPRETTTSTTTNTQKKQQV